MTKPLRFVLFLALSFAVVGIVQVIWPAAAKAVADAESPSWQSPAHLDHRLTKTAGTLIINGNGIQFRPHSGPSRHWQFLEIKTFDLFPNRLVLWTYENRGWHWPGDRAYHFDLRQAIPPALAAEVAAKVGKPAINADPDPDAPSLAIISARHRTRTGGTNGLLRIRDRGIDYVTSTRSESRGWRWADIQTLARPDPYHLRIGGYRETFELELKEPLSQKLFDRLWDNVYARNLHGLRLNGGPRP